MNTRALSLLSVAALCSPAIADVIIVNGDGTADFITIQDAIDFALPGDEVLVEPGAYPETIDFLGKGIVVRSVLGPDFTSIKAPPETTAPTVTFAAKEDGSAVLDGFKIGGGIGSLINDPIFGPSTAGGGIFCFGSRPVGTPVLTGIRSGGMFSGSFGEASQSQLIGTGECWSVPVFGSFSGVRLSS